MTSTTALAGTGPLAGVRILDMSSIVMGPSATVILAGLGAEIIKIEAPEGDNVRNAGLMKRDGMGHVFLHNNRGKRSVVLDLKQASARDALIRLAARSDVLLTNVRAAAMQRLGLSYSQLAQGNPRLIYIVACGYGSQGPYADKPAYDDLIQGATGIAWLMQQYLGGEPAYAPLSVADRVTGLHVVYSITAALYARECSGRGQEIEVPMFESVAHFVLADHMAGRSFMPALGEAGYDRLLSRHRRPYRTADGYLCVLIYNDRQWRRFFAIIGQAEMFDSDPRFSSQPNRSRHIREIYAWVAQIMPSRTTAQWQRVLDEADIPNQVVRSIDELLNDAHLLQSGFLGEQQHPTEGRVGTLGNPTRWSATSLGELAPAPVLGQDSVDVLREAGLPEELISGMVASGATRQAEAVD